MKVLNSFYGSIVVFFLALCMLMAGGFLKATDLCNSALNVEIANKSDLLVDQTVSKAQTQQYIISELISYVENNSDNYKNVTKTDEAVRVITEQGNVLQQLYKEQLNALINVNGKYGSANKNSTLDGFMNGSRTVLSTITFGLVDSYKDCEYVNNIFNDIEAREQQILALEQAQIKAIDMIKDKPWFWRNSVDSEEIRAVYSSAK